jgi:hypothetical protein
MNPEEAKEIEKGIQALEVAIEVQEGFFKYLLLSENDWVFIIKLHAFLEAVCTVLITKALGRSELIDVISRLEMSDKSYGKTKFISKLGLLSKGAINYIHKLSEIRNYYVHNLKNISISLEEYVKGLNPDNRNNFVTSVGFNTATELKIGDILVKKKTFIIENPRIGIYMGAFAVLSEITVELRHRELSVREAELGKKAVELFMALYNKLKT